MLPLSTLFIFSALSVGQEDVAKRIYTTAADSVVLIYTEQDGKPVGQGSGFVVKNGKVVTNAHVANSGKPFLMAGPAKIPLTLDRIDATNDLALLSPGVELLSVPLEVQSKDPSVGENVYVIGNPEGLEKTISQGIVSAVRDFDGRKLVQMTSPVSHGSSGGPVLNKSAEVVGVTVGALKEGQNLNFAVPASVVQKFLSGPAVKEDADALLSEIDQVAASLGEYSDDPDSQWQKGEQRIATLFERAITASWNDAGVLKKIGAENNAGSDVSLKAWRRAVELEPKAVNYRELASKQYWSALWETDSGKATQVLNDAERNARLSVSKAPSPDTGSYIVLANVLRQEGNCQEAQLFYKKALVIREVGSTNEAASLRGLINCAEALGQPEEGDKQFSTLVTKGYATYWDWSGRGDRLSGRGKYVDAGKAYQTAAEQAGRNLGRKYWCDAARNYYFGNSFDEALTNGRSCIAESEGKKGTETDLTSAHELIAAILNGRGVYAEALSHAKEAVALRDSNAWAYYDMSQALEGLGRYREAISAGQEAIKLTDGKYAFMHFQLGSVYFDAEEWRNAEQSFRKAAELDTKDADAVYNVALCLGKQGYYRDAANWFEEVLRRNPQHKDRADILERIRVLRGR